MANNLVEIIFEQFLAIVEKLAPKYCFDFNECDFKYKSREGRFVQLIDILYRVHLKCKRFRDVIVTIDFTAVCLEHLPTKKWRQYLKNLAKDFLSDIINEDKFVMPDKERIKKCRKEPVWCRFPTKCTTVIRRPCKVVKKQPKIKVLVEKECECIPICKPVKCQKKREIIIKCDRFPKKNDCNCDDKKDWDNDWDNDWNNDCKKCDDKKDDWDKSDSESDSDSDNEKDWKKNDYGCGNNKY